MSAVMEVDDSDSGSDEDNTRGLFAEDTGSGMDVDGIPGTGMEVELHTATDLEVETESVDADQDMLYQSSGAAIDQEDTIGFEDTDADDPMSGPDPGCQDLDNQDDGLDPDEDFGDIPESDVDEFELHQGQPESPEEQSPSLDLDELAGLATLNNLRISMAFIQAIASSSLDDEYSGLDPSILQRIRNPPTSIPPISDNPGMRLGLDIFLAMTNAAQGTYSSVRNAILRRYPMDEIPSYEQIKQYISDVTGVFSIAHDMCINSCLAFTGPFKDLNVCPECGEVRYDAITKKPRQIFQTILLGPLLQSLKLNEQSSEALHYRHILQHKVNELLIEHNGELPWLEDIMHGQAFNDAINDGRIKHDDLVLMMSFDGAQLYANKASDCWIFIWVILDHAPDGRYTKKRVLPGGFIPGPNKPKHTDSYLFPSLHHLSALQKEGLCMWDASKQEITTSHPFFCLATADGPGMAYLNGLVGHHGKNGCRLFCTLPGRHKQGGSHYYPALLKPYDYNIEGSNHPDINVDSLPSYSVQDYEQKLKYVMASRNETQHKRRRLDTGISKPSIFLGLPPKHRFDVPGCFGSDIMHLASLNIPDLFINLWRGTFDCDPKDDKSTWDWAVLQGVVWEDHGKDVAACTPYLPGSFDRPPRNPAEKISSGYKAWEFLLYLYGLGPALLYNILPEMYWIHYCKLVYAMRIMNQHRISTAHLKEAHSALLQFVYEFELLYCQRRPERLHFVRQSIHALTHLGPEVVRLGPLILSSQWVMERTIGNLGEEIRQHSNPYANLSERGLQRCQVNTLKAMIPELEEEKPKIPRGAQDIEEGYVLLRARDRTWYKFKEYELAAVRKANISYTAGDYLAVYRWARLQLPNGQVARSLWKESLKPLTKIRISRNVKIITENRSIHFAEVLFYFQLPITLNEERKIETDALVSRYSPPHADILKKSYNTYWSCTHGRIEDIEVISVKTILSVVSIIPHKLFQDDSDHRYFVVEKPGLEIACLGGVEENIPDEF
ncbi:hypothetical protein BYT27DRAFT_7254467 [Phlegmacium glaucopus]|nr:hypothetical protein BYT27DRAFT_7254467 [Phlegmacium glaucopus]